MGRWKGLCGRWGWGAVGVLKGVFQFVYCEGKGSVFCKIGGKGGCLNRNLEVCLVRFDT